jgi:hypothetical protein
MQIKEAAQLFHEGVVSSLQSVVNPVNQDQWLLQIATKSKRIFTISTVRHDVKSYKTLEAVISDVVRITGRLTALEFKL